MAAVPMGLAVTDGAGKPTRRPLWAPIASALQSTLSTVAAAPVATRVITSLHHIFSLHHIVLTAITSPPPHRQHAPARDRYLERALMAREMDRL